MHKTKHYVVACSLDGKPLYCIASVYPEWRLQGIQRMSELGLLRDELVGLGWVITTKPQGKLLTGHARPGECGRPSKQAGSAERAESHPKPVEAQPAPTPLAPASSRSGGTVARPARSSSSDGPARRARSSSPAVPVPPKPARVKVLQESAKRYLAWLDKPTASYKPNWRTLQEAYKWGYLSVPPQRIK